jgi:hypothetical protein
VPPREFSSPTPSQWPVNKAADQNAKEDSESGDDVSTFGVAMGIGTILVGVIILVVLGIVMVTNSGNGNKRRRALHYPEERYFWVAKEYAGKRVGLRKRLRLGSGLRLGE